MADIFISYSHRDQPFVLQLVGALAQREYTTWIDKHDVFPAGAFREDIKEGIEEAGAFIFVLSPASLLSEECSKELDYAQACGKKLIPLLHGAIDSSRAPQALRDLDWIEDAPFDRMLEKLLDALLTDKDDWKHAGRCLRLASEWDKDHRQNSGLLLHGKELKKAEDWLKRAEHWHLKGSNKKPQPQPIHIKFIHESRRAANRSLLLRLVMLFLFVSLTAGGAFELLYHNPTLVTTLNDDGQGSLRWCIENASSGSTITFSTSVKGTIHLTSGDLIFVGGKTLTVEGPGSNVLAISSGHTNFGIHIFPRASVTISHLSLKESTLQGQSFVINEGTLRLLNSTITGNSTMTGYGATSGPSGFDGDIVSNYHGTLFLINSVLSGNTATTGIPGPSGFDGDTLRNISGTLFLINSVLSNNAATNGGGMVNDGGTISVSNSILSHNATNQGSGGGIDNNDGKISLLNATLSDNLASSSGPGGPNGGSGGGIYNHNGTVSLINSTLSRNSSGGPGGGIFNNGGTISLLNTTLSGNAANAYAGGGGIFNTGRMSLINSTLSDNTTEGYSGGGIVNQGLNGLPAHTDITFCTLFRNTGSFHQLPSHTEDTVILRNSIVAATQTDIDAGLLISDGYNLIQNDPTTPFTANKTDQMVKDFSSVFAGDMQLHNNGGSTQTFALLPNTQNPALNAIPLLSCQIKEIFDAHLHSYTDQRGEKRPGEKKTACDIGAYESQA